MTEERDGTESDAGRADPPLAAVVEKPRTDATIESLRAEGVYDDERRVREYDAEAVALPITGPPADTRVREVIRQVDPDYRRRDLEDLLADRGWSEDAIARAPSSWAVIGSVVIVRIPGGCPEESELAEALLDLHGEADAVLADEGIADEGRAGAYREPRTRHLAGSRDTETIHTEHGVRYGLDPARVMFSPGNKAERARMGEVVGSGSRSSGDKSSKSSGIGGSRSSNPEHVFDMFAGIGYFTLPMARAGARVTAAEINPTAFRHLLENAVLNEVGDRVDAYLADCRDLADDLAVDRVVMGYYGYDDRNDSGTRATKAHESGTRTAAAHEFLPDALDALRPGGTLHYHEATPETRLWERPLERLETATADAGRSLDVLDRRRVKSHSAGVSHVVLDARVD